jgi:hypothetical protein
VVILETGIGFQKSVLILTNLQAENLHNFLTKSDNYLDTYRNIKRVSSFIDDTGLKR